MRVTSGAFWPTHAGLVRKTSTFQLLSVYLISHLMSASSSSVSERWRHLPWSSCSFHVIYFTIAVISQNELQLQETYLRTCAPSEASDQPVHLRRLIRIFAGRSLCSYGCKNSSCEHADLSLRWAHMSEGTLSVLAARTCILLPANRYTYMIFLGYIRRILASNMYYYTDVCWWSHHTSR